MDGFLNVLKPPGMSSAAVVGFVRRRLNGEKVGHAGTLDPEAAGVLPIMVGKATKLFDYLVDKEKHYTAQITFGAATDSQDAQGHITQTSHDMPPRAQIMAQLSLLTGEITQIPPAFSAIKQNGKPLYALARQGADVTVPPRLVQVFALALGPQTGPESHMLYVKCGKGTYVRTLCHDLGQLCACPAHMSFLLRTKSGYFDLDTALTLEEIDEAAQASVLNSSLIAMDAPLGHIARLDVPARLIHTCQNGGKMPAGAFTGATDNGCIYRLYGEGHFYGIARPQGGQIVPCTLFPKERST